MRWNCPPMAAASDLTDSVLASPGTPSTSRWPPESKAMAIRSSRTSWPTMVRLTSKSTGCSGLARPAAAASLIAVSSNLGSLPSRSLATGAERGADGYREADAGERVRAVGSGERDDHADDAPVRVEQRPARAARVDRRVELDEPGE